MSLREYLLSVTSAAVVCAVVQRLCVSKGSGQSIMKMLLGIFMALTVFSPLTEISLKDFDPFTGQIEQQAQAAVEEGKTVAKNALAECISQRIVTYILDKASQMDVQLTVQVELTQTEIPVPCKVYLQGQDRKSVV